MRYAANLIGAGTVYLSAPAAEHHRAALLRTVDPQLLVVFPETGGRQAAVFVGGRFRTGDLGTLDSDGYLHVHGRVADMRWIDRTMVSPLLVQDTLCRLPSVRYAVVVVDPATGAWVVPAEAWPGSTVDPAECLAAVKAAHGPSAADPLVVLPVDRIPLTEQGKADRAAIAALPRPTLVR